MGYSEGFRDHLIPFHPVLASSMRRSWSPPSSLSASPSSPCPLAWRKISVQAEGKVSFSLIVWKLKCVKKKKKEESCTGELWEEGFSAEEANLKGFPGATPTRRLWIITTKHSFPTSQVAKHLPCSGRRWQPQGQVGEKFSSCERPGPCPKFQEGLLLHCFP